MTRKHITMKILISASILTTVLLAGFFHGFFEGNEQKEKPDKPFVIVQKRDLNQMIIATGIIKPKVGAEVKVGAQVSGVVKDLYVRIGTKVKKNERLAQIDPELYISQKNKMFALKQIAGTEVKYAALELDRQKSLYNNHSISQQQYELASQRYELARAKLEQAEAEYNYAELQLSYTKIYSPINGVVASITTQKGETVAAGFLSPTFVTIIDLDQLELWAYVDETDIGRIQQGQEVSFSVDTYPGVSFNGSVETVYPKPEIQNSVVNYVTVIRITNSTEHLLRPEMTANVQLSIQTKRNVLTLPKDAVQMDQDKKTVTVLNGDQPEQRIVTTGISDKKYYEILSGVAEKEKVILNQ